MWDPSAGLIATKFAAPQLRGDMIHRPRLESLLAGTEHMPLTLVVAPAGSGKSTLLGGWHRALLAAGLPAGWLSLEPADDDPLRFATYFAAALNRADPRLGGRAAGLLKNLLVLDEDRLLPLLINDLAAVETRVALFLDDVHLLRSPAIHGFLERLLAHAPGNFSLFLASRSEPPLNLARLKLHDQACLLSQEELRFDLAECERFLNAARSLGLSRDDVTLLHQRTEGWAAGLRLAALSLDRRRERASFLASFSGTHREVTDFLAHDVLLRQPQEVQDFLLATSILPRFDAALAAAVTGRRDAAAMIERLIAASLFLVPLDEERRWHRYHHLFADFLRARLERLTPGAAAGLHRKAARWLAAEGEVDEALAHALAAGDERAAADLVEATAMADLRQGRLTQLRDRLARLPARLVAERPRLSLLHVWLGFHMIEARAPALSHLRAARRALGQPAAPGRVDERAVPSDLLAELRTVTVGVLSAADHSRKARALAERWLETLPQGQPFLRGTLSNVLSYCAYSLGDLDTAEAAAQRARAEHGRARSVFGLAYADLLEALAQKARGRMAAAETLLRRSQQLAQEALGPASYAGAIVAVMLAELAYERDDLGTCERLLRENHYVIEGTGFLMHAVMGHLHAARLEANAGRPAAALAALDRAERAGRSRPYRRLRSAMLNERVRLLLAGGDLAAAQAALRQVGLSGEASSALPPTAELELVAQARVLLAERRAERALRLLDELAPRLERQGRLRRLVQVLCLKALALTRAGRAPEGLETLRRALLQAEGLGLLRTVADEGAALRPLLAALLRRAGLAEDGRANPSPGYLQKLLSLAGPASKRLQAPQPRPSLPPLEASLSEALSDRELEVIRLLAGGLASTEALSRQLALAPTTVKWHLRNIFDKLGVKSRAQVIVAARELGLLN